MARHHTLVRVHTAALHRGGSIAQRDKMLGNAIAAAMTAGQSMKDIMKAAQISDVQRVVDLAAIGGYIATCTSDDFRTAGKLLDYGVHATVHEQAVARRVSAMLKNMARHYDETVLLNEQRQKETAQ